MDLFRKWLLKEFFSTRFMTICNFTYLVTLSPRDVYTHILLLSPKLESLESAKT